MAWWPFLAVVVGGAVAIVDAVLLFVFVVVTVVVVVVVVVAVVCFVLLRFVLCFFVLSGFVVFLLFCSSQHQRHTPHGLDEWTEREEQNRNTKQAPSEAAPRLHCKAVRQKDQDVQEEGLWRLVH